MLNGVEIQRGSTSDMIIGLYQLISELSSCVTLEVVVAGVGRLSNPVIRRDFRNNA